MKIANQFFIAIVLSVASFPAFADTVGVYQLNGKNAKETRTMSVSYKNDQTIRMDISTGQYMLVNGSKIYMVSTHNGKVTAMDMDNMPKFNVPTDAKPHEKSGGKVTKTGRTETIAGVTGDVWEITTEKGEKHEMVVSSDRRVQGLSKAFAALAAKMGQSMGDDIARQLDAARKQASGGLLRADKRMVLQSVAEKSQPASFYQLPAGAQTMQMPKMDPAMMQKMQEMMQRRQAQPHP